MYIPKFYRIEQLVEHYDRSSSGHFFDKDTMRFFRSRLTSHFRQLNNKEYLFITTEKAGFNTTKRVANVRLARLVENTDKEGLVTNYQINIDTIGESMTYSIQQAKTVMKNYKGQENEINFKK